MRAYINGETGYDSAGVSKYGYLSLSLVTMSNNWVWREASLGQLTINEWKNYTIPVSKDTLDTNALVPADPAKIDFFALQAYSAAYRGTIYIDWIVFKSSNGTSDTAYSFNLNAPEEGEGNVDAVKLIPTSAVAGDQEWTTATTSRWLTSTMPYRASISPGNIHAIISNSIIHTTWNAPVSGNVKIVLRDLQGRTLYSSMVRANAGINSLKIPAGYKGMVLLQIQQGIRKFTGKVVCR